MGGDQEVMEVTLGEDDHLEHAAIVALERIGVAGSVVLEKRIGRLHEEGERVLAGAFLGEREIVELGYR